MTEYEVYDAGEVGADHWQVMVEYSNKGQAKPPTLLEFPARNIASREKALEEARRLAFEFRPPDPWSPRARRVFRVGDDFVTEIDGATQTFHFRTSIVQYLGDG